MQVILSPVDSVANTYRALLPEGTPLEFQRILELKVLAKKFQLFHMPGAVCHQIGGDLTHFIICVVLHRA